MMKQYFLENLEEAKRLVAEVNSYNGALSHLEVFENDEWFFEDFFSNNQEAVRAAIYGNYNYTDEYVKFDGYGNLESFNECEYNELIRNNLNDIIKEATNCIDHIDLNNEELETIFEEYIKEII